MHQNLIRSCPSCCDAISYRTVSQYNEATRKCRKCVSCSRTGRKHTDKWKKQMSTMFSGVSNPNFKHGESSKGSVEYRCWKWMHQRCNDENHPYYGGRGIKVCEQWESYENFLADMGRKPSGLVLHRINKDGDFGPINCKWATPKEQANNQPHRKKRPIVKCVICQKQRLHCANGACKRCYSNPLEIICAGCGEKKPHLAKGFCKTCYKSKGQPRITCENCGKKNIIHGGKGLCGKCLRLINFPIIERVDKRRMIICSECCEEKNVHAKGMCSACYQRIARTKLCEKCKRLRPTTGGLCSACYRKQNTRQCKECRNIKPHAGYGLCAACHFRKYRKEGLSNV